MQTINRDAIIVSARQPLIDWVNSLDPAHPLEYRDPMNHDESTVYLIEELDSPSDLQDWLEDNYLEIFEEELFGWYSDDTKWPTPLTFELFNKWIQVSYQSMVYDFDESEPIARDEDF
jgi:hypothetical protein